MDPKVSVVVVNYNGIGDTLECITSLLKLAYNNVEIIVVDNGSTDHSLAVLRALVHPALVVLETGQNLGSAGGNNAGIRYGLANGCDYILLLNNDAVIAADAIDILIDACATQPDIGVAQGTIYQYSKPHVIWNLGASVALDGAWMRPIRKAKCDSPCGAGILDLGYASGCMLFAARTTWETVGLLDERYFFQCEDTDIGIRARQHGLRVVCVRAAQAWHKVGQTGSRPLHQYYTARNRLLLIATYAPAWREPVAIAVHIGTSLGKILVMLLCEKSMAGALAIVLGLIDGLNQRFWAGRLSQFTQFHRREQPLHLGKQ